MSVLILLGGATASGKSTLGHNLQNNISNSIMYRRYQGFFDIAKEKGIAKKDVFSMITPEEVDNWYVDICKNNDVVISDIHYAIQMDRKEGNTNPSIDIYQNYVPTISMDLLQKLNNEGVKVIAIFLDCSPKECLKRALERHNRINKELRNISEEDALIERNSEMFEWKRLLSTGFVEGIELNSEVYSTDQLTDECLEYLTNLKSVVLELK